MGLSPSPSTAKYRKTRGKHGRGRFAPHGPPLFSAQTLKKRTRAAPTRTAQRLFDRAGLKKQIWAASPSGKRSPPARPQLRKSAHRRAYQRAYQRPGTKKAPRRCWAGVMMTAQWHMVCRAPGATPGKKKSPLLETVGLSAKRTTYRNGRCVGINCRGIRNPLQSKWREFPCQTTPLPIPYVYARCMRRCAWGMADFLP